MRNFDEAAKVPGMEVPTIEDYKKMMKRNMKEQDEININSKAKELEQESKAKSDSKDSKSKE